jgi:hypothetical protein
VIAHARNTHPVALGLGVVAVLTGLLRLLYGGGAIGYDASYALAWGREILHGRLPDYGGAIAPTPHPLANLASALLSPLGHGALPAVSLISLVAMAALAWFCFTIGEQLFSWPVGLAFALILLTRPSFVNETGQALIDIPFLALVAAAASAALARRSPLAVLGLLAAAGLLRPEGWPLSLLFLALAWRDLDGRGRSVAVALAVTGPLLWALADISVTGDPLYSLHGTQDLAADLGRARSAHDALVAVPDYLKMLIEAPVAWLGLVGAVLGLLLLYERALAPAAVAGLGLAGFVLLGSVHLPVLTRYLLIPAIVLALLCAVALLGWSALDQRGTARRVWTVAGTVATIALLATLPRSLGHGADARRFLDERRHAQSSLLELIDSPTARAAIDRCGRVGSADGRLAPLLAYSLGLRPGAVGMGPRAAEGGALAYVTFASAAARRSMSLAVGAPAPPEPPPGTRAAARNNDWVLYANC